MFTVKTRHWLSLISLFGFILSSFPAQAVINDAEAINKSGHQRMLSQRIAKNYIMMGSDINPEQAAKELDTSMALFEQQFLELQEYAPSDAIKKSLEEVTEIWKKYRLQALTSPSRDKALNILKTSDQLLMASDKVVQQIESHVNQHAGRMVNISGRQRMLSQRIAKLYMTQAWGIKNDQVNSNLSKAVEEFDSALKELRQSSLNTSDINRKLRKVQSQWDFTHAGFQIGDKGHYVPTMVSVTTESILKKMNELTHDYEQLMVKKGL